MHNNEKLNIIRNQINSHTPHEFQCTSCITKIYIYVQCTCSIFMLTVSYGM